MAEILEQLHIHWQELVVNAVGFLLLVLILRRFFWERVTQFFAERQNEIRGNLEEAEAARDRMHEREHELEDRLSQIETEARDALAKATERAHEARDKIVTDARDHAQQILSRAREEIGHEKEKALAEIRDQVADLATMMAETALRQSLAAVETLGSTALAL
ncbi:MAG: F0F1 ATP synthase subunit B, partial [Armatimonadota bacterium]